ncbi:Uncharacterized protein DAT39_015717, partial [Clarias magur]
MCAKRIQDSTTAATFGAQDGPRWRPRPTPTRAVFNFNKEQGRMLMWGRNGPPAQMFRGLCYLESTVNCFSPGQ